MRTKEPLLSYRTLTLADVKYFIHLNKRARYIGEISSKYEGLCYKLCTLNPHEAVAVELNASERTTLRAGINKWFKHKGIMFKYKMDVVYYFRNNVAYEHILITSLNTKLLHFTHELSTER